MQIELVPITTIRPYENNAKIHTPEQIEQIQNSILEFGNNNLIAIDASGKCMAQGMEVEFTHSRALG